MPQSPRFIVYCNQELRSALSDVSFDVRDITDEVPEGLGSAEHFTIVDGDAVLAARSEKRLAEFLDAIPTPAGRKNLLFGASMADEWKKLSKDLRLRWSCVPERLNKELPQLVVRPTLNRHEPAHGDQAARKQIKSYLRHNDLVVYVGCLLDSWKNIENDHTQISTPWNRHVQYLKMTVDDGAASQVEEKADLLEELEMALGTVIWRHQLETKHSEADGEVGKHIEGAPKEPINVQVRRGVLLGVFLALFDLMFRPEKEPALPLCVFGMTAKKKKMVPIGLRLTSLDTGDRSFNLELFLQEEGLLLPREDAVSRFGKKFDGNCTGLALPFLKPSR